MYYLSAILLTDSEKKVWSERRWHWFLLTFFHFLFPWITQSIKDLEKICCPCPYLGHLCLGGEVDGHWTGLHLCHCRDSSLSLPKASWFWQAKFPGEGPIQHILLGVIGLGAHFSRPSLEEPSPSFSSLDWWACKGRQITLPPLSLALSSILEILIVACNKRFTRQIVCLHSL